LPRSCKTIHPFSEHNHIHYPEVVRSGELMLTRRRFSALAAAATGAVLADPLNSEVASMRSGFPFGVQLFTVRNDVSNLAATFRMIHSIGYATIETFPIVYNRPAKELKALIQSCGLTAPSGHFDYATLEEKIDYAAELGLE
jgi:glutaminase